MPPTPSSTYERLRETIAKRMRMSHIDQPLMLMELLGRRSPAPAQDVARRILGEAVTQIDYTTERVKRMVGKVHLQRHHPLRAGHLRPSGRRGGGLFAHAEACGFGHRSRHRTPISGSIKVRVLTRAKGRCECCGAGCCLANPAPAGPGGGPHRAQEPGRLGRAQQPAVPLLPLQCRPAMGVARRAVCSARWRAAAGCCWRTNWRCASPMPIR